MKVLIATKNQGKIEGAKKALELYFKDIEIRAIPVESDLSEVMNTIFEEDKERHNHGGGIQLLPHNKLSRIDLTEEAFIMALTKYINGENWR